MRLAMFLRGINVGGRHRLPMADVRAVLADIGATQVATYIQSGNIVLTLPEAPADQHAHPADADPAQPEPQGCTEARGCAEPQDSAGMQDSARPDDYSLTRLTAQLAAALEAGAGFPVPVHIRTAAALRELRAACPFTPEDPRFCHMVLLDDAPAPERLARIDARLAGTPTELAVRDACEGAAAYLLTPGGLSASSSAGWVLTQLGGTARNLRTIDAVLARL